jgi:hypothetical protein
MTSSPWLDQLLFRLGATGEAGEAASGFLRDRRVRVRLRPQSAGARWTPLGDIELNPIYARGGQDEYALSLLVHEVHHLKQGKHKALSVHGELEAWQVQFAYLRSLAGKYSGHPPHEAIIAELMSLSFTDRAHLTRARTLMQSFAGKKYRIDLLPLYPLLYEIRYWLMGQAMA